MNNIEKHVVLDTNVLLDDASIIDEYKNIFIPCQVLEEIDGLKKNHDVGHLARKVSHKIELNLDKIRFISKDKYENYPVDWDESLRDNKIILCARDNNAIVISNDLNVRLKCASIGIESKAHIPFECTIYKGYKEIIMSDEEMSLHYENPENKWGFLENEYLLIKDSEGNIVDRQRWVNEKGFTPVSYKTVDSRYVGRVKPRNIQQELYMDLLQNKNIKLFCVQGAYGSGKDYLALSNFLNMVDKGQYNKIVWVRNNIEAKDTKPIGYLPGSITEKLSAFADIVGDFVGDRQGFEFLLNSGKLELVHTGFLRGRDLRNCIIYCTEAQNMSQSLMQLIVSRVSEGSIAFFNGDVKQIDDKCFSKNNGLNVLINKLKGNPLFGYVYLDKCERSEVAQLASLLD